MLWIPFSTRAYSNVCMNHDVTVMIEIQHIFRSQILQSCNRIISQELNTASGVRIHWGKVYVIKQKIKIRFIRTSWKVSMHKYVRWGSENKRSLEHCVFVSDQTSIHILAILHIGIHFCWYQTNIMQCLFSSTFISLSRKFSCSFPGWLWWIQGHHCTTQEITALLGLPMERYRYIHSCVWSVLLY